MAHPLLGGVKEKFDRELLRLPTHELLQRRIEARLTRAEIRQLSRQGAAYQSIGKPRSTKLR